MRRLRTAFIIVLMIPFSLIIAFILLYLFGYTINLVSLMSLAITSGMVVDNGITVLENITRHVERGGRDGEIAVKGPMVFKGYWNLPEDTAQVFRCGWQHIGDLGRFDEDGFLWYEGRKADKELIKPGGENVYPAEVEKAILEHPAFEKTVVFGVPDPKWKEGIKAVCRLKAGQTLEPRELIDCICRDPHRQL